MKKFEEFDNYPLEGQPYYDENRAWVSPLNFLEENLKDYPEEIQIHDCTLRDGEQTPGVSYTLAERLRIAKQLDELGVDRIEIGMPIISEEHCEAIKKAVNMGLTAKVVPFARANPKDIELSVACGARDIIIEHNLNPYTCKYAYGLDQDALLRRISESVAAAKKEGLWVNFMGWDFTRAPLEFSRKAHQAAVDAGADAITLVDTTAVATPDAIGYAVRKFHNWFPKTQIEIHVHNDFGTGIASSLMAIKNGAKVIHSSMNALGERTGNVATEDVATTLGILLGGKVKTNIKLDKLAQTGRVISDITGVRPNVNKTVFGENCFGIETGIGSHLFEKMRAVGFNENSVYPFIPAAVGRKDMEYRIGAASGSVTMQYYLEKNGMSASKEQIGEIVKAVKEESEVRKALLTEEELVELMKNILAKK
ncbi:LeuA family protein [uncultured Dysosmobacter sp.]|uniref:LeuA family protein n=1 Tax=uncultured Dysosmobacter sp. TaxID=2591384 RepID=UPI0026085F9C|nr:hypothetical protein [uncultured Dysosmobacter sp.]